MIKLAERLLRWTAHPRLARRLAGLSVLLALTTAWTPFFGDDLVHNYSLRGNHFPGGPRGAWDLYRFAGDPAGVRESVSQGIFPWWTSPDLRLAFFRPLASLWRAADYALWHENPLPPHLETCLLYGLLVALVARLYGRVVGGAAAGLAALFFAVDDAHSILVTWTANRYALLAAILGFAAFSAHLRARQGEGSRLLGPALFALALASGETSLGLLGYFVAYAWFSDPAGKRAGLRALAPYGIPLIAWAIVYQRLQYGARASTFYIDPGASPLRFVKAVALRLPLLSLGQIAGPPSEAWSILPVGAPLAAGAALIAGLLFWITLRAARGHAAVPMLACGSLLSAIPVCGVMPDDRLLLVPGFGAFGVLAIAMQRTWQPADGRLPGRARRAFFGVMAAIHLVIAPLLLPLRGPNLARTFDRLATRGAGSLPSDPAIEGKTLIVLGTPDSLFTSIMIMTRALSPAPGPARAVQLTVQQEGAFTVERTDERTLEVRNPDGECGGAFTTIYRDQPFTAGETADIAVAHVELLSLTSLGLPSALRFTFREPLGALRWVVWQEGRFVEVPPPVLGELRAYRSTAFLDFLQH